MDAFKKFVANALKEDRGYLNPAKENLLVILAVKNFGMSGTEAMTIIEDQKANFDEVCTCPNCGSNHFANHRICDSCDFHYPEEENTELKMTSLIKEMNEILSKLKALPKPNIFNILKSQTHILFPILTVYAFILALVASRADSELFLIFLPFTFLFGFLWIVAYQYRKRNKNNLEIEKKILSIKYTKASTLANRHYGNAIEVKSILAEYDAISNNELIMERKRPMNTIITYGLFAALLIVVFILFPKQTYAEKDEADSKAMLGDLMDLNKKELVLQSLQTSLIGSFSDYLELQSSTDTFVFEVKPISSTFPEGFFSIKAKINLKTKKNTAEITANSSVIDLKIEILDKNKMPVFRTITMAPINFDFDYKPGNTVFSMEFWGVTGIKSSAEAKWYYAQKESFLNAKYFVVYGSIRQ